MAALTLQFPLLCLITDPERPNLLTEVEQALTAGVGMLQLRGHQLTAARLYELAQALRPLCRHYGAAFLVNDRLDVGLASDADGFQLGRHSLPLREARALAGENALLGASVHTLAEAQAAVASGADFLVVGTIFPSSSHPGMAGSGTALIATIKRMLPTCPLLAIGGITSANAGAVMAVGADGIAVISAIFAAPDITQAVQDLRMAMKQEYEYMKNEREQTTAAISILANGQLHTVEAGSTVADLLRELAIAPARVVVQLDGVIVARTDFAQTALQEGSQLEIVTLVGGG